MFSDGRDKTEIKDVDLGLDFIKELRPRQFYWDQRMDYVAQDPVSEAPLEPYEHIVVDGSHKRPDRHEIGFVAQEFKAATDKFGVSDFKFVETEGARWGITTGKLFPPIVNAIKELDERNMALAGELAAIKAMIAEGATLPRG
jgi:hypothetical protein